MPDVFKTCSRCGERFDLFDVDEPLYAPLFVSSRDAVGVHQDGPRHAAATPHPNGYLCPGCQKDFVAFMEGNDA